jgi:formate hydrogenlyase subunit 3/multisubunit Na+/H+ antiporter MnhD subunit
MDRTAEFGIMMVIIVNVALFAMIFGIVYLTKRERLAMIERGMDPRRYKPQTAPFQNLKWGLLLIGCGVGLFLAYLLDHTLFNNFVAHDKFDDDYTNNWIIYFALVTIFGGLGLFASYHIEKRENDKEKVD